MTIAHAIPYWPRLAMVGIGTAQPKMVQSAPAPESMMASGCWTPHMLINVTNIGIIVSPAVLNDCMKTIEAPIAKKPTAWI